MFNCPFRLSTCQMSHVCPSLCAMNHQICGKGLHCYLNEFYIIYCLKGIPSISSLTLVSSSLFEHSQGLIASLSFCLPLVYLNLRSVSLLGLLISPGSLNSCTDYLIPFSFSSLSKKLNTATVLTKVLSFVN